MKSIEVRFGNGFLGYHRYGIFFTSVEHITDSRWTKTQNDHFTNLFQLIIIILLLNFYGTKLGFIDSKF